MELLAEISLSSLMQYIFDILQIILYNAARFNSKAVGIMKEVKIANQLKLARTRADLTQEELADRVGVTRQTIGLIEVGKFNPSLRLCLLLARVTKTPLNELFWEEEDHE